MLTKDLLRTRTAGKNIQPLFIDPEDKKLLTLASTLLEIYSNGIGSTAEEIQELCLPEIRQIKDLKLAKGILKIVDSHAVFSSSSEVEYPPLRKKVLFQTARLLQQGKLPENPADVRSAVLASLQQQEAGTESGADTEADPESCIEIFSRTPLYADLPENDLLTDFKKIFAKEVLHRYNVALVQTLLLSCRLLECELFLSEEPVQLRRIFKYLKFFRLLFRAELKQDRIHLQIDGPASILENSNKYGFQMACFFPALCLLSRWELRCRIQGKTAASPGKDLKLNHECCLQSHFSNFSAYLPEEIKMFADLFARKQQEWQISDSPGYLNPRGQMLIFPDFIFTHQQSGKQFYLELFHRWHSGQLEERLEFCAEHPEYQLLLGVDRALLKQNDTLKQRLQSDPRLKQTVFLFRDFPGVSNVLDLLQAQEKQNSAEQDLALF